VGSGRVETIHAFQKHLAEHFSRIVPVLQETVCGATMAYCANRIWELATWMPGTADFCQNPNNARLDAAMSALAAIHNAPKFVYVGDLFGSRVAVQPPHFSRSIEKRFIRLEQIIDGELRVAQANVAKSAPEAERRRLLEAIKLITQLAPRELTKLSRVRAADLPLQYRLGDVHDEHVLFTGDEVTGIIDFGAVDYDAPAGDVARLLGSLVGDDRDLWQRGLTAYAAVRPLTDAELSAVSVFHSSGTVVGAANWFNWLWGDEENRLPISDYARPLSRLARLTERLKCLAAQAE
jgi:Ser/Thr protein kinase RdoA (MazF antagonist)